MHLELFTIGHSTHSLEVFLDLLCRHAIGALADIRRFSGSRRYPHFNRETFCSALRDAGVEYRWYEALGGRRTKPAGSSKNLGLRNESLRNYADYMATEDFKHAIADLLELARRKRTALMCSEGLYWRCHRRLVSDYLLVLGCTMQHVMPGGQLQLHSLTQGIKVSSGELVYTPTLEQGPSLFE